ncbi:MAG: amidohydrolase family protein [Solirubrobacterales bacterium]
MTGSAHKRESGARLLLRWGRLEDGRLVDVRITAGRIDEVVPAGSLVAHADEQRVDLTGHMLLPAPAEPHAHLDKAFTADRFPVSAGALEEAIDTWHAHRRSLDIADIAERARRAALLGLRHGATACRTHVDVGEGIALRGVEALIDVREDLHELVDIQIVALAYPLAGEGGVENRHLLRDALAMGADLVGGAPHVTPDPTGDLEVCLDIASEFGKPVDLHVDEHLRESVELAELARHVADGFPHPVTASHCVSLGMRPHERQQEVAAQVARSGIGVVACPLTNLLLQGRDRPTATPRGLTAIGALREAGVTLAGGGDNVQDAFNPLGRCDPLVTAQLLVAAGQLDVAEAWRLVSDGARAVMGMPAVGVETGAPADLLAVPGGSLSEVLASATEARTVIRAGRIVSRTDVVWEQAPDRDPGLAGSNIGKRGEAHV